MAIPVESPDNAQVYAPPGADITECKGLRVLVVEGDAHFRDRLTSYLEEMGHSVTAVDNGQSGLDVLHAKPIDAALLDLDSARVSGLSILAAVPVVDTDAFFIMMASSESVESALEATRLGAHAYLHKPFEGDELRFLMAQACGEARLRGRITPGDEDERDGKDLGIIGKSDAIHRLFRLIRRVAPTRANVLITGETGTGKELVARAVHELSPRARRPFVAVNCSAVPATLIEAELFGHVKGSFTGAIRDRKGLIQAAEGGTLFLDEISTLSHEIQVKLLRVLQDHVVQRVGSSDLTPVDFRLVTATNQDLTQLVHSGEFREDFFFRLNVFPLRVPALRERREDVPLLATYFARLFAEAYEMDVPKIPAPTMSRMLAHQWPGNVRELENFIERIVIMFPEGSACDLGDADPGGGESLMDRAVEESWTLERLEREYLLSTLERSEWRRAEAAEILGIDRRTIHRKLTQYRRRGLLPLDLDS